MFFKITKKNISLLQPKMKLTLRIETSLDSIRIFKKPPNLIFYIFVQISFNNFNDFSLVREYIRSHKIKNIAFYFFLFVNYIKFV